MTKEEQNSIITEAWTRNLRKHKDIPENVGIMYVSWLRNLIKQASQMLMNEQAGQANQGQGPAESQGSQQGPQQSQEEAENGSA